jgi:hypothetical protein
MQTGGKVLHIQTTDGKVSFATEREAILRLARLAYDSLRKMQAQEGKEFPIADKRMMELCNSILFQFSDYEMTKRSEPSEPR